MKGQLACRGKFFRLLRATSVVRRASPWKTWQRPTLPRLKTQYHWRGGVSRPSSGWIGWGTLAIATKSSKEMRSTTEVVRSQTQEQHDRSHAKRSKSGHDGSHAKRSKAGHDGSHAKQTGDKKSLLAQTPALYAARQKPCEENLFKERQRAS